MKQVGIFFGSSSGKTAAVAEKIREKIGGERADLLDVEQAPPADLLGYELLILGISTWGIGEMQEDWKRFLPGLTDCDLSGKKVALFGLGDQESYPGSFADALGRLYRVLVKTGCEITGSWPVEGYLFEASAALEGGRFVGLILDEDNQPELTDERIDTWLNRLWDPIPAVSHRPIPKQISDNGR